MTHTEQAVAEIAAAFALAAVAIAGVTGDLGAAFQAVPEMRVDGGGKGALVYPDGRAVEVAVMVVGRDG